MFWNRTGQRAFLLGCALLVIVYSVAVLAQVAWMGDIGVRCILGTDLKEPVPAEYLWTGARPQVGDTLRAIGAQRIDNYTDYIRALRGIGSRVGDRIGVRWRDHASGAIKDAQAVVIYRPLRTYIWSLIWFCQEMLIFAIGARVFWKRTHDVSARLFFWLCIVTVGAYMGGYHWTEIVVAPPLIFGFAAFAVFVPVVGLHFYLVFPRENPVLVRYRRGVLGVLYGIPTLFLMALWASMLWSRWLGTHAASPRVELALRLVRALALGYIALAVLTFVLGIVCLGVSYLGARTRAERNQVKWILLASLLASLLIGYLLGMVWFDTSTLGRDSAAWPMFGVSLLYTLAYALSLTRYRLMQDEELINRSVVYVALSVTGGLVYSGMLVLSGMVIGDQFLTTPQTSWVAGLTMFLILVVSELARKRFQKVIDRQFFREKYKFDQAMRKMRVAVGSLVDRATLGRRLVEAAAEVLRLEWGAIYLAAGDRPGGPLRLVACLGPTPDEEVLEGDNPLVVRLRAAPFVRVAHTMALAGASDPATDAMIALGGEVANALEADGVLAGLLVLGPKRSGMPYEAEEIAFLGALSSVAALTLHSAGIQQTLEALNQELRDKVEKIAEQQRRILILQDQLVDRGDGQPRGSLPPVKPEVFEEIKGSGAAVQRMIALARKVAASPSAVLIRGESGTGKELLAEAIHAASPRAARPFVKVHCAALSQNLLESELFGHVKGAFTGADRDRVGRFEQAHGGTLFLDEIGDINLEVQTKLLRVLQEMSFERVGSSQPISVDVRILAATHQDLEAMIRAGQFREDLYYRINVFSLRTPSLRERKEDIFELAVHFLGRHAQRIGKPVTHLDDETVEALVAHDWPGNIRELENVIERAVVLSDGPAITRDDLPIEVRQPSSTPRRRLRAAAAGRGTGTSGENGTRTRPRQATPSWIEPKHAGTGSAAAGAAEETWDAEFLAYERQRLIDALTEAQGNHSEAARLLGMPRSTLCSKLRKHGLFQMRHERNPGPGPGSSRGEWRDSAVSPKS
jgi:transcriptional regulator with GAF, ATPase, and Fis domain